MFEPVLVPGQGEKPTADALLSEVATWVRSAPLRTLVERFGGGHADGELPEELAYLDGFTAAAWDFRKKGSDNPLERNQIDNGAISGEEEAQIIDAAAALGLVHPRPPTFDSYDHVVMLGGLVRANIWRPAYAAYLLGVGVESDSVVALTAYRRLARNERDPKQDEYELLRAFGLPSRTFECEVMEDGLRRAFDLPELVVERESAPDVPDNLRFRVAVGNTARQQVSLVVAPTQDSTGKRRADTAATYRYWASEIGRVKPEDRVLVVTSCIYVPYQHAIAMQHLALPFGCRVDTVGIDHQVIDDSISPQVFRGANYLQEIRSALRAYRRLVRMLRSDAALDVAW